MKTETPRLRSAYALEGVEQVKKLYRDWATTYDADFIERMGYAMPRIVAEAFGRVGGVGPILDVGCGSGAVGVELAGQRIDGLDLSPEMLDVAVQKGVYTRLVEGNLQQDLPLETASYRGIVSAGTFTHGHVGPEALDELIRVSVSGAIFCLGINAEHFETHGFAAKFAALRDAEKIGEVTFEDRAIYDTDHDRSGDRAMVAIFRRA